MLGPWRLVTTNETTITSYADIDFKHPEVVETDQWADWFIETTGVEGFRLMRSNTSTPSYEEFHPQYYPKYGEDFYVFAEF